MTPPAFVRMSGRTGIPRSAEDRVGLERGRAVRALGDHARPDARRVLAGDLILARREDEDVAVELEQLVVREPLAGVAAFERAVLAHVGVERGDVEPALGVEPAGDVRDGDDRRAERRASSERRDAADVAESLDDAALVGERPAQAVARARDHHDDARAGRLVAEHRAADRDRLAGHDLRHGVAALHRVRVHHPRHRLLVRRHVRRRDVLLRADDRQELRREAPRQPLELAERHAARIAANAALRAAVRKPEERALPRHPHRERGALAERHLRVVADAALRRAGDARVLDAVAGEDDAAARRPCAPGCETIVERSGNRRRSAMSSGISATGTAWSNCATAMRYSGVSHSSWAWASASGGLATAGGV